MKKLILAVMLLVLMPAIAQAGGRSYDRGHRYHGHGSSNNFFGLSLGFGGDSWFGGFSYNSGGYYPHYAPRYYPAYRPYGYYAPRYYAPEAPPVVIYREPAYIAPPVIVDRHPSYYAAPPRSYPSPHVSRYYYGR